MATIQYPTKIGVKYYDEGSVYLRADSGTCAKWCTEKGYTYDSFVAEPARFSNDGALNYAYWGPFTGVITPPGTTGTTTMWQTEFGYSQIVVSLTYH